MQEEKERYTTTNILNVVFALIVLTIFCLALIFSDALNRSYLPKIRDFNDGWKDADLNEYQISNVKATDFGGEVELFHYLPYYVFDGDSICFESKNVDVQLLLDNREIYKFNSEPNVTGAGYGVAFHEVGISQSYAGRKLVLRYKSLSKDDESAVVFRIYLGSQADYIRLYIYNRSFLLVSSSLIIFFGLLLMVLWLGIPDKTRCPFDVIALGMASVIIGLWCLINTNVPQLMSGHYYFWRIMGTVLIPLAGYPIVVFINSLSKLKKRIYNILAFSISVIAEASLVVMRYVADVDMLRTLAPVTLFVAGCDLVLILIIALENKQYCLSHGVSSGLKSFYSGIIILIAFTLLDVIIYMVRKEMQDSYGALMRFGLVIFIIVMILQFVGWWTKDQAAMDRDRFINRSLQFAATSRNPVESIKLLLEYLGKELNARRTYILEIGKEGKLISHYEWFIDGLTPMSQEIQAMASEKELNKMRNYILSSGGNCFVINNAEDVKNISQFTYQAMEKAGLSNVVFSPLTTGDELIGFVGITDIPQDKISVVYEIMKVLPYFFAQFIGQRKEQERVIYYSYHDYLSGAQNRIALKEFTNEKLDISQTFGYVLSEIAGLREINNSLGHDVGDEIVKNTATSLMDVFGDGNVYRISGESFVAFGFESDENYFDNDVEYVKRLFEEKGCSVNIAAIYCSNGTSNIDNVIKHAFDILESSKELQEGE